MEPGEAPVWMMDNHTHGHEIPSYHAPNIHQVLQVQPAGPLGSQVLSTCTPTKEQSANHNQAKETVEEGPSKTKPSDRSRLSLKQGKGNSSQERPTTHTL